jgi:hypothetical protein
MPSRNLSRHTSTKQHGRANQTFATPLARSSSTCAMCILDLRVRCFTVALASNNPESCQPGAGRGLNVRLKDKRFVKKIKVRKPFF